MRAHVPIVKTGHCARLAHSTKDYAPCLAASANSISSINIGSSAGARELFTRFDTGHRRSTSSAAGLSTSTPRLAGEATGSN